MATLRLIVVPPEFLRTDKPEDGFAVVLGDLILPGHILGRYPTADEADAACLTFAEHYGLQAYPMTTPGSRRAQFKLIIGGKTDE